MNWLSKLSSKIRKLLSICKRVKSKMGYFRKSKCSAKLLKDKVINTVYIYMYILYIYNFNIRNILYDIKTNVLTSKQL